MNRPNFFIIGAPKSGTTALREYLKAHPRVYFSPVKEPGFFCPDIVTGVAQLRDYLHLFGGASTSHTALGEATTLYLRSEQAVPRILEHNPDAKLIVMLRNPIEMAYSLHAQNLYWGNEKVRSFERAWNLQRARATGSKIPSRCTSPFSLQYGWFCSLGEQIEQLFANAPLDQIMIVMFDDFKRDPRAVYARALNFLGLKEHVRNDFTPVNSHKRHRLGVLFDIDHFLRRPSPRVRRLKDGGKRLLGVESFHVHRLFSCINHTVNLSHAPRRPLSAAMEAELRDYFAEDVAKLSGLLGRDLSHWLRA